MHSVNFVSAHGGHSGQFCEHAKDSLEEIILQYIQQQFLWAGITEHTPASSTAFLDPGQQMAGLTPESLLQCFAEYMQTCRKLQKKYKHDIEIFVAMEIETYSGYLEFVPFLINRFKPDYIVGSVHFVDDIIIDYSKELYQKAIAQTGSIEKLYHRYFDQQFEMIDNLSPSVVGHFDLIRIFDAEYKTRIERDGIWEKIERNLKLIKEKNLILDFNLRALAKGASEPYPSKKILKRAVELDIQVVPGDDSHSVASVGNYMNEGIDILTQMGSQTKWPKPRLITY